jgi:hypothetical protein
MQLTSTFHSLLHRFRSVFTAPTFATFLSIATGWCLSHRHRYVTEMIQSSGAVHLGHHSRYHRFFGNAAWSIEDLFESLAREALATLSPEGLIELGIDDSLCRKRGLTIFGTGMHHDPLLSSRKRVQVSWGHDWVILSLLIPNPPWSPTKVWALPVGMKLYRNRQGMTRGKKGQARSKKAKKRPLVWRQLEFPVDDHYFSRTHQPVVIRSLVESAWPSWPAPRDSSARSIPRSRSDEQAGRSPLPSSSRP